MQQIAIAAGILASLFATGWLLGLLLPPLIVQPRVEGASAILEVQRVVRWASLAGTAGILFLVLVAVEVATLLTRLPPPRRVDGSAPTIARTRARPDSDLSRVA